MMIVEELTPTVELSTNGLACGLSIMGCHVARMRQAWDHFGTTRPQAPPHLVVSERARNDTCQASGTTTTEDKALEMRMQMGFWLLNGHKDIR